MTFLSAGKLRIYGFIMLIRLGVAAFTMILLEDLIVFI